MYKSIFLTCTFAAALSAPATMAESIKIYGNPSCMEWAKVRKKRSDLRTIYEWWVSGFISGLSIAGGSNVLGETEIDSVYDKVDAFCLTRPDSDVMSASYTLYTQLKTE